MDEILQKYKCQHVRNLIWLLISPSPLDAKYGHFRLFSESVTIRMFESNASVFDQLDMGELKEEVESWSTKRLGIYAENLLAYFFKVAPNITLLSHSFQVIRDKVTIGELDYVLRFENQVYHVELAVKYYLGRGDLQNFENWIGPSGNDKLSDKLNKVLNHQLTLANEPEVRSFFDNLEMTSCFLFRGVFFVNSTAYPSWLNLNNSIGKFYGVTKFVEEFKDGEFSVLQRPHWMSDLILDSATINSTKEQLFLVLKSQNSAMVRTKSGEVLFVVNE